MGATHYFNHFDEAKDLASELSQSSGKAIQVKKHGRGFEVVVPSNLEQQARQLLYAAAETLVSNKVNVGAFTAGILMLLNGERGYESIPDDSLVLEAFRRSDSSLSDASVEEIAAHVAGYSGDQLPGLINNVKGIYHEIAYVEAENSDGDAWTAELMPETNAPNVDVILSNDVTGETLSLQLKATDAEHYVHAAVTENQDVIVQATTEVADSVALAEGSGFSNAQLTADVEGTTDLLTEGAGEAVIGEMIDGAVTGGIVTGAIGIAAARTSKNESGDLAGAMTKAAIRGALICFGISFF
jgi:hypothetical protein